MKGVITILLLVFAQVTYAQSQEKQETIKIDERLYEVFEKSYLEQLKKTNPFLLQRWAFYLDHSYYISEYPEKKGTPNYPTVNISDLDKINILLLEKDQKLTRDWKKQSVYKIQNSNKILVFYSGEDFNEKLNQHLSKN